jgi:SAM-dependent methyltransferase
MESNPIRRPPPQRPPACAVRPSPAWGTTDGHQRRAIVSSSSNTLRSQGNAATAGPDLAAVKARQRATWAAGDYAAVGTTLQIVGERICEAVDLRAGERVLDVAAGNGNATLAAARRFANVTSTDYVRALLGRGRELAAAEGLPAEFREADAEALPFPDASFDVALSTFGVMFTPDQERAAGELARIVRPGGRIGLANWTPEGFIGQVFKNHRQACAAAGRREIPGAVRNRGVAGPAFPWLPDPGHAADLQP